MMRPAIFICFLSALLVDASAIREFRKRNVQENVVNPAILVGDHIQNLDDAPAAELSQRGYTPRKVYKYKFHSFTWGQYYAMNNPLIDANITIAAKPNDVVSQEIRARVTDSNRRISRIEVIDLHSNEQEKGWAYIISGGPGYTQLTIDLVSAVSTNLAYRVRVYEGIRNRDIAA